MSETITVYGAPWCSDCVNAKQFLAEHQIPYEWIDITDNNDAIAFVEKVNHGNRSIPTIVFSDGGILIEPTNAELAARLSAHTFNPSGLPFDVAVIGGGVAGLTAAIYTAREGARTVVIEKSSLGGQLSVTQNIENFPGFPAGVTGRELAERLAEQAQRFGVEFLRGDRVAKMTRDGDRYALRMSQHTDIVTRTVVVASGSHYKRLHVPGEEQLIGRNVHFCAVCDGAFYKGKDLLVIGGGNTSFEEGLFLADKFARSVTILVRGPKPRASKIVQDRVMSTKNIRVLTEHTVREFQVDGGNRMHGVVVEHVGTGEAQTLGPDGVFVFIGLTPNTQFLPEEIRRDEWGFLITDQTYQTSMPGIFAAGDVRQGSTKQAVAASAEGATAALMVSKYLQAAISIPTMAL